jgi:hypothetical protein
MAVKGPDPVEKIIGGSGKGESDGIGNIFLDLQYLLEEISGPEIDENPGKSYYTELDKFQQEDLVNKFG